MNEGAATGEQSLASSEQNRDEPKPLKPLSVKNQHFVEAYLQGGNATKAAIAAGYSEKTAAQAGSRLLRNLKAHLEARRGELAKQVEEKTGITHERLVTEALKSALSDVKDLFDANGKLLPIHEMPESARRALASIEHEQTHEVKAALEAGGEPEILQTQTSKIRLLDKLRAIELVAKLQGYLREKRDVDVNVKGEVVYRWKRDDE
jgi:phage terminase small subunit